MHRTLRRWIPVLFVLAALGAPATAAAQDFVSQIMSITQANNITTYNVRVCYRGPTVQTNVPVALYYDRTTAPTCNLVPNDGWLVSFPASAVNYICFNYARTRANAPIGSYTAWSFIDVTCTRPEIIENNNIDSQTYVVRPDLQITAFTSTVAGTTVTYSVTIRNAGASTTTPFNLAIYYDRAAAPACGVAPSLYWPALTLAAGATITRTFSRLNTPAGVYRSYAFVDYSCVVNESVETNNIAGPLNRYVGPNLFVSALTAVPSGSTVVYTVTVCNSANASTASGTFNVSLWYSRATDPTCTTTGASYSWLTVASLAAGTCTTLPVHTRTLAPPGNYVARAFVDSGCQRAEYNETDNVRAQAYTVAAPNYRVSAFSTNVTGTTVVYSVTVCNSPAAASSAIPFSVGLYYNRATAPACANAPDYTWTVNGLASGACTTVLTYTRTGVPTGNYTGWAFADSGCDIAETNENNNTRSTSYSIAPTQPDLYIASFSNVVVGTSVAFTAVVCNAGVATTANFLVGVYYDRATAPTTATTADYTHTQTGGLAAAACATISHTRTSTPPGTYNAWVMADRSNLVTEYNETNNTDSDPYTVAPPTQPDLTVTSLTVTVVGQTVTYVAQICNNGAAASTASTAALFYDTSVAPTCVDTPSATAAVGALAVSGCETKTWTQSNVGAGGYTAWVLADSSCGLSESNETNNTSSKAYTVVVLPPDAGVPDTTPPTPDASPVPDGFLIVDGVVTSDLPLTDALSPDKQVVDLPPIIVADGPVADKPPTTPDQAKVDGPKVDGQPPKVDGQPPKVDGLTTTDGPAPATDGQTTTDKNVQPGIDKGTPPGSSGCSCEVAQPAGGHGLLLLLGLGLLIVVRRRRR